MNKLILIGIVFVLFLPLIYGEDTDYVFKGYTPIDLKVPCFNKDYTFCVDTTICTITINYPDGSNLVNNGTMTNSNTFYNYTINQSTNNQYGEYSVITNCASATESGKRTFTFGVNPEGSRFSITVVLIIVIAIIYFLLIFAIYRGEYAIGLVASMGLIIIGIYVGIYGIGGIDNILTQAFALINIVVGAYILIRGSGEEAMKVLG